MPGLSFRLSVYLLVCVAGFCLGMGEDEPPAYPWFTVLAALAATVFTDELDRLRIPAQADYGLGPALLMWCAYQYWWQGLAWALALAHLLVAFQLVLFFRRKDLKLCAMMAMMSFGEVAIAAIINNQLRFGLLLGTYAMIAVGVLVQFHLWRESGRYHATGRDEPRGQIGRWVPWRTWLGVTAIGLATITLGQIGFLLIPRSPQTSWRQVVFRPGQLLTGFDEEVQLGELGTILESDDEVMTAQMFDERGRPYVPAADPKWRGLTLWFYTQGRWSRGEDNYSRTALLPIISPRATPARHIRQEIQLQPIHRDVLFGLRPVLRGLTRDSGSFMINRIDGTLTRPESIDTGPLQYTLLSDPDPRRDQPFEDPGFNRANFLLQVPDDVRIGLGIYIQQNVGALPDNDLEKCRRLLSHLRDSGQFDYSLRQTVTDAQIDPVLDFLQNRQEGHCEYFASALALMLRTVGVRTRLVNGFSGGDRNDLGQFYVIRQKHAHSWVEAWVRDSAVATRSHWLTLDPTPGAARQATIALVDTTPSAWRQVRDASRQLWSSYVLNYNAAEQQRSLYGPLRRGATNAWQATQVFFWQVVRAERGARQRLLIGLAVLALGLAGATWGVRQLYRLARRRAAGNGRFRERRSLIGLLRGWLQRLGVLRSPSRPRVAFYDRLLACLRRHALEKAPGATPRQFAEQARTVLAAQLRSPELSAVPAELVEIFYRIRYGSLILDDATQRSLDARLRQLEAALKTAPCAGM
jgi:hypothetical protein